MKILVSPRLFILLLSLLYACENKTKHIVIEKLHQPDSIGYTLMPTYDPFTGVSSSSLQPVPFPESWMVKIEGGTKIEVSQEVFDTLEVGEVLFR